LIDQYARVALTQSYYFELLKISKLIFKKWVTHQVRIFRVTFEGIK